MATQEKDLKSLSDSELDSLIEHSIEQQETVKRHGSDYQHLMNVTAAAKEEKARRGDEGIIREGERNKELVDNIKDDKVEESNLSTAAHEDLHITPDPTAKDKKEAVKKKTPKPTVEEGEQIPADRINQGIPGIEPKAAKKTPENRQK